MSTKKNNTNPTVKPKVSIVIPVYNKVEYTKKCINSILKCNDDINYEIIVVNNASTDNTAEYLSSVNEVFVVNNQENLGFVEACNIGASKSSAEYIFFLNNDTEVKNNWLNSSIKIMEEDRTCGIVGSKLVFPNGKLQEAGAIIFNDANGWNFGYNENPELPEYNKITEVDYCSGASLLIRNNLFKKLNGFDTLFAPAYYEDSDLCFRVRQMNYKVIYNPKSVVVHHESVTAGKDPNTGFKKYLNINRQKFYERWKDELKYHLPHPNVSGIKPTTSDRNLLHNIFSSADSVQNYMKKNEKYAVMFFPQNPIPSVTGAHQRFVSMMDAMHQLGYKIIFFSTTLFGNYPWDRKSINYLSKTFDAEVIVYTGSKDDLEFMFKEEKKMNTGINWEKYNPPGLVKAFQDLVKRIKPAVTFINYAYWANLIENNRINFGKKLIDMHDLVTLNSKMRNYLTDKMGAVLPYKLENIPAEILNPNFFKNKNIAADIEEYQRYDKFDILFSISKTEEKSVKENTVNVKVFNAPMTFPSFGNNNNYQGKVILVIGDNAFNIQGYYYFVLKILPLVKKSIPDFKLHVIGDACKNIEKTDGVELLGRVDDLEEIYSSSKLSICPLIGQTGMSVKIVESMAHGVPVIALGNSAKNSPIKHEENGIIANDEKEFAKYLIQLSQDNNLCKKYGKNAVKTIKANFSSFKLKEIVRNAIQPEQDNTKEISSDNRIEFIDEKTWVQNVKNKNRTKFAIALVEHFGDIVACEPVARFIKANFPDSHITWYVKRAYKELVTYNNNIDEVYIVDSLDEWSKLKNNITDAEIIDLHINNRICFTKGSVLMKNNGVLEINANNYYFYGPLLVTLSLSAGLPPLNAQPKLYIPDYAKQKADALSLPANYVVFHCLSNEASRDWEKQKWIELTNYVINVMNVPVIEVGGAALLTELAEIYPEKYRNLCGKLSLLETGEVIKRADVFVGIDSGPAHLANATNTYGIILLGQYRNFKKYLPYTGSFGNGNNATIIFNENGPASEISVNKVIDSIKEKIHKNYALELNGKSRTKKISKKNSARLIAFYLPQFHPIPENDKWWGKGFTEWKNVTKAKPLFEGHYQPHLPGELGYYDLRLPEVREAQANLAKEYGIEGFCYWHYWFNGKRLLEKPFNEVLSMNKPDFPFCLAWANENWTKRWDGMDSEILQKQTYGGLQDDEAHFNWLLNAFTDKRYIRIENKPVFLIYNPLALPDVTQTLTLWQKLAKKAGLKGIYTIAVKSSPKSREINWKEMGFDAELLFQPNWQKVEKAYRVTSNESIVENFSSQRTDNGYVINYDDIWPMLAADSVEDEDTFSSVIPMWDNSARKPKDGVILHNSTPGSYKKWLGLEIEKVQNRPEDKKLVFVNAWNEWAEGNHIEPDAKHGREYLAATKKALSENFSDTEKIGLMVEIAIASLRIGDTGNYNKYLNIAKSIEPNEENKRRIELLINTKHSKIVNQKGILAYLEKNYNRAYLYFQEAIALNNNNIIAKRNLAQLFVTTGNLKDSINTCNQILTQAPGDKAALYLLFKTYQKSGELNKAIINFKKLILLSDNNIELIQRIQNELLLPEIIKSEEDSVKEKVNAHKKLTSIIFVTYNQLEYTKKFVDSILKHTTNYELIAVDNNSTDNTKKYLKELKSNNKNIKVIFNDKNLGFPKAVNQGILEATGEYILLINNDTVVTKGWLERMIKAAESKPEIGIVGPISNSVSGVQLDKTVKYETMEKMYKHAEETAKKNKNNILEFPRVAFLCTLIKKEVIEKIGGLDERFTPGNFEDDDFCLRAQLAGYKTVIATDVFIHHYGSVSFKQNGENEYAKRLEINKQKFVNKWGATPEEIWLEGKNVFNKELKVSINNDLFIQSFERALANINDEEYDSAIDNLKLAMENFQHSERKGYENISYADILNMAGTISLAKNRLEDAKEFFEEELKTDPASSSACMGLGEVFYQAGMFEESKTMLEWAVVNNTQNTNAQKRLEEVNLKMNLPPNHNSVLLEQKEKVN